MFFNVSGKFQCIIWFVVVFIININNINSLIITKTA